MHPRSRVVIVGSITDGELLAAAYTRGAQGLLFWDPDHGHPLTPAWARSKAVAGWPSCRVDGGLLEGMPPAANRLRRHSRSKHRPRAAGRVSAGRKPQPHQPIRVMWARGPVTHRGSLLRADTPAVVSVYRFR
jgi:hypothetical protein